MEAIIGKFMIAHPAISTFLIILILISLILAGFGIYNLIKMFIKKGGEVGPVKINKETDSNIDNKTNDKINLISKKEIQFIPCISSVIKSSINIAFRKSVIRQDLYDKQILYMVNRFDGIISEIAYYFITNNSSSVIKYIEIILNSVFKENIYIPLEKIFKNDRMTEKTEDAIIEEHRHLITSASTNVLADIAEYSAMDSTISNLADLLKSKQEDIKQAMIDSIKRAYEYSKEEVEQLEQMDKELNREIMNALTIYMGSDINNLEIPKTWSNVNPPNDIVGEVR